MSQRSINKLWIGLVVLIVLSVFEIAFRVGVDYSDAYHLLLNAKTIASGEGAYDPHRFILGSVAYVPAFWLERGLGVDGFRAAHLFSAGIFGLLGLAAFLLYRETLPTLLFLATPLLIHYAPFAKEDLLAVALAMLSLGFYRRERLVGAGVFAGLAIAARYNFLPILLGLFAIFEGMSRKFSLKRAAFLIALPILVTLVFPAVVYPWIGRSGLLEGIPVFLSELGALFSENDAARRSPWIAYRFLFKMVGAGALALAVYGFFLHWKKDSKSSVFFGVWLLWSLFVQSVVVPGKEARYLFICLPPIFYFVSVTLKAWFDERRGFVVALGALFIVSSLAKTTREFSKFRDPFYSRPFAREVSLKAKELLKETPSARIFWVGSYYGTFPSQYRFDLDDPYAYIYHLFHHVVFFHTGEPIAQIQGGTIVKSGEDWRTGVQLPQIDPHVKPGDVLIVNPEKVPVVTSTVSDDHPPLLIQRVRQTGPLSFDKVEVIE